MMFLLKKHKGFNYYISDLLEQCGIKHLFSTIKDEINPTAYGINFGFNRGLPIEEVQANYKKVSEILKSDYLKITRGSQIHSDTIYQVEEKDLGKGVSKKTDITDADALITNLKDTPLCVFTADCVPVLLADKNGRAVCTIHAGWRGTALDIVGKGVKKMTELYGITPSDIICAIGPCISKCCFEVSKEVYDEFFKIMGNKIDEFSVLKDNCKYNLDLKSINKYLLMQAGIFEDNIDVSDECTYCNQELFYSYRRDGEKTGRMGAFITL